jgi:RND superfamily putative drug exporter
MARHPWRVLGAWLVIVILVVAAKSSSGGVFSDSTNIASTESHAGLVLLSRDEPGASGFSGLVVLHSFHGVLVKDSTSVAETVRSLAKLPDVVSASNPLVAGSPQLSRSGTTAIVDLQFKVQPKTLGSSYVAKLNSATGAARAAGLEVEYGGGLDQVTRPPVSDGRSELIGFVIALIVLVVGFGSVVGAALPILTALSSVVIGLSLLSIVAAVVTFGTASPTLAAMIGIGVGIDYAVFLTTRFRQLMQDGDDPVHAAGLTVASSGRAVLTAAISVSIALFGLYASGVTFIGQLGFAGVFGVATGALGAITLVPAGLRLAGGKIDRWSVRMPVAERQTTQGGWSRYARSIGRHPWRFGGVGVALLVILAIPLLSLRLGHVGDGADPTSYTDKRAYDLISTAFGPGANGPLTVVLQVKGRGSSQAVSVAGGLDHTLATVADVASVRPLQPSRNGAIFVGSVVPKTGPQNAATERLFYQLIDTTLPHELHGTGFTGYITGETASQIQFDSLIGSRLPIVIAVVLATALILILMTFGSLTLAIKAVVLNLLSIGASYGVIVAVFQWGWGRSLLGVSENVPIEGYVPTIMFAIVFGLSMDYEIFLLSRVKEHWDRTRDHLGAIEGGLMDSARVISCAALIMVSVFASFAASTQVDVKMIAIGLAVSVLIDASVVRLLLVPSVMVLLGDKAWWMPAWLERVVPRIRTDVSESPGA